MRIRATFAATAIVVSLYTISAYAAHGPREPDYIGTALGWDATAHKTVQLERETPFVIRHHFLDAVTGQAYGFHGASSPTRFNDAHKIEFVVRMASQDEDPMAVIQFFRLDVKHDTRILPVVHYSFVGTPDRRAARAHLVQFTAKKYGKHSVMIRPTQPLAPGEYAVSLSTARDGFLFGVDPVH